MRLAARLFLLLFCALSSFYALLCYTPFTWNNFIVDARYPASIGFFLHLHGLLLAAAAASGTWALWKDASCPSLGVRLWGAFHAAAGLWLMASPLLTTLQNDPRSLVWAFLLLEPALSWELLQFSSRSLETGFLEDEGRLACAPLAAGLALFLVYSATHLLLRGLPGGPSDSAAAFAWSFFAHILAAAAYAALLGLLGDIAERTGAPRKAAAGMLLFLLFAASAAVIKKFILASFSFEGPAAAAYAATGALLLSASALNTVRGERWPVPKTAVLILLALAPSAAARFIVVDWNALLQTLSVLAVWAAALLLSFSTFKGTPLRRPACVRTALLVILAAWGAYALSYALDPYLRRASLHPRRAALRLAEEEPSFRTLHRLLSRTASGGFFQLLQSRTNLPRSTPLQIPDVELSTVPAPGGRPPDVFIIVIDSLRPDYLGAYDPKAGFTPAIDEFAKESVVFRRAFSAYGGTGLSEPSLWTGALLPHLQYPSPFSPMNPLEKLLKRGAFRPLITMDAVLSQLLAPSDEKPLDENTENTYELCRSLSRLEARLEAADKARPVFAYTQPQNIHVSIIDKEGGRPVSAKSYPGFDAPYASRVERMDACFGRFVDTLKSSGRWEESLIILTADHGDSLGEGGRRGHAYTIFPEVLRVPLIVRAPKRLLASRRWDPDAMALLIDVAPTLYELLGRTPAPAGRLRGRPLFRPAHAPAPPPRAEQLVASSYGPVYGLLQDEGRRLYVADGVGYKEHLYQLGKSPVEDRSLAVDPKTSQEAQSAIRDWLRELHQAYGIAD